MERLDKKTILLFIVLMLILAITIYVYTNKILEPTLNNKAIVELYEKNKNDQQVEEKEEDAETIELTEEEKILELKSMNETERIHQYFSTYINSVDKRDYETAYGYLYQDFKQNYFPNQEIFKTYIDENYPMFMGIQYEDIDRQGAYYILKVLVYDAVQQEKVEYKEQSFIIYELDFGEFVLSFQV